MLLIVQWSDPYCTLPFSSSNDEDDVYQPDCCPVTRLLRHCAFDKLLCDESPACLTTDQVLFIPGLPLDSKDYIVNGAHHGKQLHTRENVSSVLGVSMEVRLQLMLDEGKLESLEMEAESKREYSWSEILKIATARLTLNDLYLFRWRQTDNFENWTVVRQVHKLNHAMKNIVEFLYYVFCDKKTNTQQVSTAFNFEQKLEALRGLRRSRRLEIHVSQEFGMKDHPQFNRRNGPVAGEIDVILHPPSTPISHKFDAVEDRSTEKNDQVNPEESGAIIVELKATSNIIEDHRLQIACYGSMYQEEAQKASVQAANGDAVAREQHLLNSIFDNNMAAAMSQCRKTQNSQEIKKPRTVYCISNAGEADSSTSAHEFIRIHSSTRVPQDALAIRSEDSEQDHATYSDDIQRLTGGTRLAAADIAAKFIRWPTTLT
eukprot:IDg17521t1